MLTKAINVALVTGFFTLISCSSAKNLGKFKINKKQEVEGLTPLPQSYSTIPVVMPLKHFYDDLSKRLSGFTIQNIDFPDYTNLEHCKQAKYQLTINNVAFSHPDVNTLRLEFGLHYVIWGRSCRPVGGGWLYGDCENDGNKLLSMIFDLNFPYPLTKDALGSIKLRNVNFHNTECEIGFELWETEAHNALAAQLQCSIEKQINAVLSQSFLQTIMTNLHNNLRPDIFFNISTNLPRGDLKLRINNISIGKIDFSSNNLNLTLGVNFSAVVCTEDINPTIPTLNFTQNKILEFSDQGIGLNNNVAVVLSYETINTALNNLLIKKLPPNGNVRLKGLLKFVKFKIDKPRLSSDAYGNLNIKVRTLGCPNATINIIFYPVVNTLSNTLILKKVSYSIKTKNLLVKIVKPFYKKSIRKAINNNSIIQFNTPLSNTVEEITNILNNLNLPYMVPNISENKISVVDIKPTVEYLVLYINQTGSANMTIKSQQIIIPLPKSPYKPAGGSCN